ncbi:MAG: aminoacetone oxidase family FAD-binding enzyme [Clostridia bacterium]|nr:aminoacetone oxidase family FAD-binding enzyme [Clostridia bacterium]
MNNDVMIIGGGAAGLSAALSASGQGARVTVIEGAPRLGRKILASGNGRCNLANAGEPRYYGEAAWALQVFSACPVTQVLAFFEELGLVAVEEAGGRIYPGCGQAAAVLDVLRAEIERRHIPVICEAPVAKLCQTSSGFRADTPKGSFAASRTIVACGGMAGGKLGHDGKAYQLLTGLGHTLIFPRPALTQIEAEKRAVKGLSGLRLPARLTLCEGKRPVSAAQGEVLFTDYGVSGVCAMQLSRDAEEMLAKGKQPTLYIDFSPMLGIIPRVYDRVPAQDPEKNLPAVRACIEKRRHILPPEGILTGLAPRLLSEKLRGLTAEQTARALAAYPVPITGVRGFEHAQVTSGGIACREFSPATLESSLCPGLYCAGEMLNVDGDCGGFNLQFAFATGILAGKHAAE